MAAQPPRINTRLAVAIIVAALVIAAAIFASFSASTRTVTETSISTVIVTISQPPSTNVSLLYLSASGVCSGPGGNEPCWDNNDAYIFDCANSAATPEGCDQVVISALIPADYYTINIQYPFTNQTTKEINELEPSLINCLWTVRGNPQTQGYAHCLSLNSVSFIVGEQAMPTG
jgi:hypothetical protein